MPDEPNLIVVDAFKSVIDAALQFDALWLPDYGEIPEPLKRSEAELLADYVEEQVEHEPDKAAHMRSLVALAQILPVAAHWQEIVGVLHERADGRGSR